MTELMIPQRVVDDVEVDVEVEYPDTDGEPIAEGDHQRIPIFYLIKALQLYYAGHPNVYVSGCLMMYYVEGDNRFWVAPDVFVVFGVAKEMRDTYLVWKEGKGPDVVIEVTSRLTRKRDQQERLVIYRNLGVQEYFLYDPTDDYLLPALQGMRLDTDGKYVPITPRSENGLLALKSDVLGLELHLDKLRLRLYVPTGQSYLLSHQEPIEAYCSSEAQVQARAEAEAEARRQSEARAEAEAEARRHEEVARRQAEEHMKTLEAELRRLRQQGA